MIALAETMEDDLDAYIGGVEGNQSLINALEEARGVYQNGDAMQEEVNDAWQKLLTAMADMMLKPDKNALTTLVAQAEELNEADYEAEGFSKMRTALASAKAVLDDEQATQEMVDASADSLKNAIANLTQKETSFVEGESKETETSDIAETLSANAGKTATDEDKTDGVGSKKADVEKSAKTGDSLPVAEAAGVLASVMAAIAAFKRRRS